LAERYLDEKILAEQACRKQQQLLERVSAELRPCLAEVTQTANLVVEFDLSEARRPECVGRMAQLSVVLSRVINEVEHTSGQDQKVKI
jgi:hypothetical protein